MVDKLPVVGTAASIVSAALSLASFHSGMESVDKKFVKIIEQLKDYDLSPENIDNILSTIIKGQSCERIVVTKTRIPRIFERKKIVFVRRIHFVD